MALQNFEGTLIVISHDREFLQGLCDKIFEFRDGQMKEFLGNIDEYLDYRQKESIREVSIEKAKLSEKPEIKEKAKPVKAEPTKNTFISKEQKNLQNKLKKAEEKIADYEAEIASLEEIFSKTNPTDEELKKYNQLKEELAEIMKEWEEIMGNLE